MFGVPVALPSLVGLVYFAAGVLYFASKRTQTIGLTVARGSDTSMFTIVFCVL